ncbi:MAG: GNAT family N-acetyltransferase [Gemmatimonadaceae bacterium]|nr:GNAT family N-acetyltransferase [Gemmatimonadaceae bacterium]
MTTRLRLATADDVPHLTALIEHSARTLSVGFYDAQQTEAVVRHVFGVDTQLIVDGTYFVIECDGTIAACGGWSRRSTLFGGDQYKAEADALLEPAHDAARIRAFFVHPDFARRGLGRMLLDASLNAARAEGFTALELVATMPAEPPTPRALPARQPSTGNDPP